MSGFGLVGGGRAAPAGEMIVDSFAGGGGASTGIEMALGRSPDLAINHDPAAIALHRANHPGARHLINNIYRVDPCDHARPGQAPRVPGIGVPLGTVVAGGQKHGLVAAFLAQHNAGPTPGRPGRAATEPVSTVTTTGSQQSVVAAHHSACSGEGQGSTEGRHALVAEFMTKYYGQGEGAPLDEPCHTVTTRDRFGLVTVSVGGVPYVIEDIGMRMLAPRELYRAQGFPESYTIDEGDFDGERRALTKSDQIRMCGNSVCPPLAAALVAANVPGLARGSAAA